MPGESMTAGDDQFDERTAKLFGTGAGVMNGAAIGAASLFVFESNAIVFGALVGLFSAVGSALLLPWIFQQQTDETEVDDGTGGPEYEGGFSAADEGDGGINTAALGAGLEAGAVGMFAARLALDDILLAVGGGVAAALAVFLLASVLFGRAERASAG